MDTDLDLAKFSSPAWWRALAPTLHVEDRAYMQRKHPLVPDEATAHALRALMLKEGYFQLPPHAWPQPLGEMVELVKQLAARGIPLPFSFIYDEFWCLYLRLNPLIEALLGPGFMRLPDFWTWHVDPRKDESGWGPHRDKGFFALFPDGSPKSVTVWIPLTDATTLNGCMYIVPADRDPDYGTPRDGERNFKYPDIRALPVPAGSVLCWNQAVLHWGAHSVGRERTPRVSVAFEYQSGRVPPFKQPLTRPYDVPAFAFRLRLIGKQIVQYRHMYPLAPRIEAFARRLYEPTSLETSHDAALPR